MEHIRRIEPTGQFTSMNLRAAMRRGRDTGLEAFWDGPIYTKQSPMMPTGQSETLEEKDTSVV